MPRCIPNSKENGHWIYIYISKISLKIKIAKRGTTLLHGKYARKSQKENKLLSKKDIE